MNEDSNRQAADPPSPSAGWFQNSEGVLQWWDGEKWGPVVPVASSKAVGPASNQHSPTGISYKKPPKSVSVAYVFLLFLGNFGAHRFYVGSPGVAIIFIITWLILFFGVVLNPSSSPEPISIIATIIYVILYLVDLFTIGNKVRSYNAAQGHVTR